MTISTEEESMNLPSRRAALHRVFENYLNQLGYRQTRQRRIILDAVLSSDRHVDAETIAAAAKRMDPAIGLATVYRTLKMMTEAGILVERHFGGERATFEFADPENEHHDHLICKQCGEIIEFFDEIIEERQAKVAASLGFKLSSHKMELFADCNDPTNCSRRLAAKGDL